MKLFSSAFVLLWCVDSSSAGETCTGLPTELQAQPKTFVGPTQGSSLATPENDNSFISCDATDATGDITVACAETTTAGDIWIDYEFAIKDFKQEGEDFHALKVNLGPECFFNLFSTQANDEFSIPTGGTPYGTNYKFITSGSDGVTSTESAWSLSSSGGDATGCQILTFKTTLNYAIENCGFAVDSSNSDQASEANNIDNTVLSSKTQHTSFTSKQVRDKTKLRVFERNTKLDINMGTIVTVISEGLSVFGFAISEFAVTVLDFDPMIRCEDCGPDNSVAQAGEDLRMVFVTSVQWPYVLRSDSFTISGAEWEQQVTSRGDRTSEGTAEENAITIDGQNVVSSAGLTVHKEGKVLEIKREDCDTEQGPCYQEWEVIVARTRKCSDITPLDLDAAYESDFLIGCSQAFSGTCVLPSQEASTGAGFDAGVDQSSAGKERFITGFTTSEADGDVVSIGAGNKVVWSSDSDNYCTRVLDEIPLEGSIAVYDTEEYDQIQDQFVFGSTAFVKVHVHARAEIAHVVVEKIQLDHTRGGDESKSTQFLHSNVISENAGFAQELNYAVAVPDTLESDNVPQADSLLEVQNDRLEFQEVVEEDESNRNELLNEATATFHFVWNEHTSPAGSADEDEATTTTITVDVRVQFKAAARRMRALLQAPAATPATRQAAVVGVVAASPEPTPDVVAAAGKNTAGAFAALALGLCVA